LICIKGSAAKQNEVNTRLARMGANALEKAKAADFRKLGLVSTARKLLSVDMRGRVVIESAESASAPAVRMFFSNGVNYQSVRRFRPFIVAWQSHGHEKKLHSQTGTLRLRFSAGLAFFRDSPSCKSGEVPIFIIR
jgi:hypothetical protein